jgi:hypothetical protein
LKNIDDDGNEKVLYPITGTSDVFMSEDENTSLQDKLGNTDISGLGDGTITGALQLLFDIAHPIGDIICNDECDTMEKVIARYGGRQWERIEGRCIVGASASHSAGTTFGSDKVSISGTTGKAKVSVSGTAETSTINITG